MSLEPEVMRQLLATFQVELEERLQTITDGLLALEKNHKKKGDVRPIIEAISRAAHNIKGAARGIGISAIGDIVHHIESIFSAIKENNSDISADLINLCLHCVDAIRSACLSFAEGRALDFDLGALLQQLEANEDPGEKFRSLTVAARMGQEPSQDIRPTTAKKRNHQDIQSKTARKRNHQDIQSATPRERNHQDIRAATVRERNFSESKPKTEPKIKPKPKDKNKTHSAEAQTDAQTEAQTETQPNKAYLGAVESESIRIPVTQIERVSVLIEQMQINKIGIEDNYKALLGIANTCKQLVKAQKGIGMPEGLLEANHQLQTLCKTMRPYMTELDSITTNLQEDMARLRLVPASSLLRHLERYVRDLALELNKEIELEISGAQVKLDKMILDGLKDPIIHILRNAMDHGIESQIQRKEKGKPACGKIRIDLIDEGNQILIHIADDGAGIDPKQIAKAAVARKIITETELAHMSEDSILDFIFRPEFSTKAIITTLSGRGIGLDVVRSNVADLKGTVSFTTQKDKGTTFHLHLPLTLSSDIGLTIKSGGQRFVLPVGAVEHVMMIPLEEIREVEGNQVILFEDRPVPLRTLSEVLSLEKYELASKSLLPIVIMKKGWNRVAFLVEAILGECDIVIKPLQAPLSAVACVSGGTLFGTGEIIIVLNPAAIIKRAYRRQSGRLMLQTEGLEGGPAKPHILLVDDSITTRILEKNILESNDYQVTEAVDGAEAWELLQKQDFSLVITDIQMPKMDGFELTERIKTSSKYQDMPVIIVTSLGSDDQKKHGIDVGANAYIVKHDFESTELLDIVEQLV